MGTTAKVTVGTLMVAALACAGDRQVADAELARDLELASATGLELASAQFGNATAIVSAAEQVPRTEPVRAPAPRRAPGRALAPDPAPTESSTPEPEQVEQPSPAPVMVADVASNAPPAGRPAPIPVSYPAGGASDGDRGRGPSIGDILGGVIIRGGSGGVDDCEIHLPRTPPRSGGSRVPGGLERPGGTSNPGNVPPTDIGRRPGGVVQAGGILRPGRSSQGPGGAMINERVRIIQPIAPR